MVITRVLSVLVCVCLSIEIEAQQLTRQNLMTKLTAVSFCDTMLGWAVGEGSYRTTDGGIHWTMEPGGYYESVSAAPGGVVWASWISSSYSWVGRSVTAGSLWDTVASVYWSSISALHVPRVLARDSLRAWIAYAGGWANDYVDSYKTLDGGRHWTYAGPLHRHGSYTDIGFGRDSAAALLFDRGYVFRTSDEAQHWRFDTLGAVCNALALSGTAEVWVVGDAGNIYHSRDTASIFSVQLSSVSADLNDVTAIDSQTVWAVGNDGTLLKTTNGGDAWVEVESGTNRNLTGISFVDRDHGWIVGDSGVVLIYTRGNFCAVECKPFSTSGGFLYHPYPNPFNPSTTIRYELPWSAHVMLNVYDVLGREIATLVNGEMDAGYHEVKFDGSGLASGVYLYRMQAGSYVEAKKLLLVR